VEVKIDGKSLGTTSDDMDHKDTIDDDMETDSKGEGDSTWVHVGPKSRKTKRNVVIR